MRYWCCEADFGEHTERCTRVTNLVELRQMSRRAAEIVVDAAMFGIGCTEGIVRDRIQKELEANDESKRQGDSSPLQSKP